MDEHEERTFIMVKPDGVQRALIGDIIKRFEQKGFKLVAMKFVQVPFDHLIFHKTEYCKLMCDVSHIRTCVFMVFIFKYLT